MSEVKIKELDKSLIHQANSNSMSGQRGDISAHEYEVYCQKVMSWNIPDSRKQKIVDQIYAKWSEQLRHEAAHVSVAVAGPARYNAKKLDHSDTILRLSSEFVEWFNGLQEQVWQGRIEDKDAKEIARLVDDIKFCIERPTLNPTASLCEHLFDGPETIEGLLAEHYTLSWALASLRDKLKHYEDAGIPEIMPGGLQTIDRAIETYGKDAQLTKAVEEMSELTKALCKYKECQRKYDNPLNRKPQEVYSNIEEEIADVFIMLVQLLAFFRGRESVSITKIVWDKLDRLKDNLDKETAKQEGGKDESPEH